MAELSLLAKATIVLGLALGGVWALRGLRASVRALVLSSAFGVLLALPAAPLLMPERVVEIPVAYDDTFPLFLDQIEPVAPASVSPSAVSAGDDVATWRVPSSLLRGAWFVICLALVVRLGCALWRLRAIRRTSLPWLEGQATVSALGREAGIGRRIDLFLHEELPAPMTFGVRRPAIGLPIDAPRWPAAALRDALIHELEHVRRCDWPIHLLARVVCALYWFHPLVWVAARRLCLEAERACDDAVLRDAERTAYAQQLVTLARRMIKRDPVAVLSMAARSDLSTRVRAVLDANQARGRAGAAMVVAIGMGALAMTAVMSPLQAVQATRTPLEQNGPLSFEVASIRRNSPDDLRRVNDWNVRSGRLHLENQTLLDFIGKAYGDRLFPGIPPERISGGPDWIDKERFTIQAKAPDGSLTTRPEQRMGRMLRTLLEERFGLKVRVEPRQMPAYALVMMRDDRRLGPALHPSDVDCDATPCHMGGGRARYTIRGMPMHLIASAMAEVVGLPVVDKTGLTGGFDGTLEWTPDPEQLARRGEQPEPGAVFAGPSIFTAVQEQWGMRLVRDTAAIPYLLVEDATSPSLDGAEPPQAPAALRQPPPAAPQGLAAMVESPTSGPDAPRFEVASIRRNAGPSIASGGRGGGMTLATGQVRTTNSPLRQLITMAYGLRPTDLLLGGPDWIDSDGFDVDAKPAKQATVSEARLMLRTLLAERFKLVVRRETREMPVYALTIARADGRLGPRIARPAGECVMVIPGGAQAAAGAEVKPAPAGALGPQPPLGKPGRRCGVGPDAGEMKAGSVTMTTLITLLTPALDRPIVDKTGLSGTFDFDLRYAGARLAVGRGAGGAGVSPEIGADPADGAPTIFTALQEQLGLKLEATRGPVDVLVVHQAEPPTEN